MAKLFCLFSLSALFLFNYVAALSSLTFVIDDTSSMWNDIAQVRRGAGAILDTVLSNRDESQIDNFIIVTFNDRSDQRYVPDLKLRAKTKDRNVFISALNAISTSGGAITCPELPLAGIKRGLEESLPKSTIYVFTDATAKDFDHYEEVKRLAQEKQCQIVFVLTGTCGQRLAAPGYKVYQDLAQVTNGELFNMNKGEIDKILDYVRRTVTGQRTTLANKVLPQGVNNITIDTDPLMGEVLVSVASPVRNNLTVNIKGPDGNDVRKTEVFRTNNAKVYSVNPTVQGQHIIEVNSPSGTSRTVVSAKSRIDFQHGFSTFVPASIDDTSIRPAPGVQSYLSIQLISGAIGLQSVQILDMNQNVIRDLPLAVSNSNTQFYTTGAFDPPATDFIITIVGFDPASKTRVMRQVPTPVEFQKTLPGETISARAPTVVIDGPTTVNANYGARLQLVCKVAGYPRPSIFWKNKVTGRILSDRVSSGKNYPYDYINVLTIETATENATYSCEARNRLNFSARDVTVVVTRSNTIRITSRARNITVEYQREARFFCRVEANPPATIKWYKNDVELKAGGNVVISNDNAIVTISNGTPADTGKYTCEATSGDDKETTDNFLVITGLEDVEIDKRVTNLSVIKRHSITIECKILKGNPKPSISWTLETPEKYIFNIDNWKDKESNVLINVNERDAGIYRCRAENDFSRDHHGVRLVVA